MRRGTVRMLAAAAVLVVVRTPLHGATPQRNPLTLPSSPQLGPFSIERLSRWVSAVRGHEPGSADVYAQTTTPWYRGDLEGALRDFGRLRALLKSSRGMWSKVPGWTGTVSDALYAIGLHPADVDGQEILERAAILHTDIATGDSVRTPHKTDAAMEVPLAGLHLSVASACVDYVKRDAATDPFIRRWYAAVAASLQSRNEVETGPGFIDHAVSLFPADPDLRMIQGYMQEYLASPHLPGSLDMTPYDRLSGTQHLQRAEQAYRLAIELGVKSAEVAMRLGRVVGLQSRHQEALSCLTPALEMPADRDVRYFLFLFVGLEEAALDRDERARQAYLRAQAIFPSASSGYLALSHLARRAADRPGAAAAVQSMLALETTRTDPWPYYYGAGHQGLAGRLLFALRAPFRKAKTP